MLYPIELLRQTVYATRWRRDAEDGVHGNGHAFVCHVVRGLFTCQGKRYRLTLLWVWGCHFSVELYSPCESPACQRCGRSGL